MLDPDILQLCILNRADIRNDPNDNSTQQFRKAAYRQIILDKYGYLGRGNRKVVAFYAVWKVSAQACMLCYVMPSIGPIFTAMLSHSSTHSQFCHLSTQAGK